MSSCKIVCGSRTTIASASRGTWLTGCPLKANHSIVRERRPPVKLRYKVVECESAMSSQLYMPFKLWPDVIIYDRCEALRPSNKPITGSSSVPRELSPPSAIAIDTPTAIGNLNDEDAQAANRSDGPAIRRTSYDYGFQVLHEHVAQCSSCFVLEHSSVVTIVSSANE